MSEKLLRFDWAIKKLLRSKANFGILEGFLSELLKQDIKILEVIESESNREYKEDKSNKIDIAVKNEKEEIIIVEIQVATEWDFLSRLLFGVSKVLMEHIKQGESYIKIKKVYSVGIIYFDLGQGEDYVYYGTTGFRGIHKNDELQLKDREKALYKKEFLKEVYPEYYIIKVNQFNDIARDTLDEWIYFLKNERIIEGSKARGLAEAGEKLRIMNLSENERDAYESYTEDLMLSASVHESHYGLGKIEGLIEGEIKGEIKGKIESIKILVTSKFGIIHDEEIAILNKLNAEKIESLLAAIINVNSYDEFKAKLTEYTITK